MDKKIKEINGLIKKIDKNQEELRSLTKGVVEKAEGMLMGKVVFSSTQEYDDNNYYTYVSLNSIDGQDFSGHESEIEGLDPAEVEKEIQKIKKDPKFKVKEVLHLQEQEETEDLFEKVVFYCLKKNIPAKQFVSAVSALNVVRHLPLPEDRIEFN